LEPHTSRLRRLFTGCTRDSFGLNYMDSAMLAFISLAHPSETILFGALTRWPLVTAKLIKLYGQFDVCKIGTYTLHTIIHV
jgi:hypothetical protein